MNSRQAMIVTVLVAIGLGVVAAAPAAAANETNQTANETNETGGLGVQITAFMQSSSAETTDTVESGLWEEKFEQANESEQARLATNRTKTLEERIEELRERNETLQNQFENGSISRAKYVAEASRLEGRIAALRSSVETADRAAEKAGVNDTRLQQLREQASEMDGPNVSAVARGVANPPVNVSNRGPGGDGPTEGKKDTPRANGTSQGKRGQSQNGGGDSGSESPGPGPQAEGKNKGGNSGSGNGGSGNGSGGGNSGGGSGGPSDSGNANSGQGDSKKGGGDGGSSSGKKGGGDGGSGSNNGGGSGGQGKN
ncbi:MAG: hypothetical protein ABEH35_04995 [Haloarculaceae archaeon]